MDQTKHPASAGQPHLRAADGLPWRDALLRARGAVQTIDGASLTLLWLCIGVARLAPRAFSDPDVHEPLVAFLALPLVVILPRQIGMLFAPLVGWLGLQWQERDDIAAYVVAWLTGTCASVIGLTAVVGVLSIPAEIATIVMLVVITLFGVRSALEASKDRSPRIMLVDWRDLARGAIVLALIAVPLVLIRTKQPFPLQTGWGVFNYNYHLLRFVEWNQISLAPGLHTPVLSAVAGVAGLATGATPEGLLWAIPILQYLAFGVGTYLLVRRLTRSDVVALSALWIALWVLAFEIFRHLHGANLRGAMLALSPWIIIVLHGRLSGIPFQSKALALHLALPATVMVAVAVVRWLLPEVLQPWILVGVVAAAGIALQQWPAEARTRTGLLALVGGALALIHLFEGPIFFAAALAFVLLVSWQPISLGWRVALAGLYASTVLFILVQATGWLSFSDASMISRLALGEGRANAIQIPFEAKLVLLERGLPFLLMGLLAWSALRTLFQPNSVQVAALACISLAVLTYFLPESGLHRVVGPAVLLVGLAVALELRWIAEQITQLATQRSSAVITGGLMLVALIAMTPTLTYSMRQQVFLPSKLGFPLLDAQREFTSTSRGEYDAARWINHHAPSDWAVVSDPTTMFIMQGLTLRPQVAEKRAWVAESEYSVGDQERLSSLDDRVFRAPTDDDVLAALRDVTTKHDGAMIVFSYRTLDWLLHEDPFRLIRPQQRIPLFPRIIDSICEDAQLEPCPSRFFKSETFDVVYHHQGVAIIIPSSDASAFEAQAN